MSAPLVLDRRAITAQGRVVGRPLAPVTVGFGLDCSDVGGVGLVDITT